jgi:hypothetical protein
LLEAAKRWNDAVTAWNEWIAFVNGHPSIGNAANGRARIDAIHHRDELEQQYAPVRQRIEQRRQQNARGPQQQQQQ